MNALDLRREARPSWYADGLRWIGGLFNDVADYLDQPALPREPLAPMPRHTSYDEIVGELRNRVHAGIGGQRHY